MVSHLTNETQLQLPVIRTEMPPLSTIKTSHLGTFVFVQCHLTPCLLGLLFCLTSLHISPLLLLWFFWPCPLIIVVPRPRVVILVTRNLLLEWKIRMHLTWERTLLMKRGMVREESKRLELGVGRKHSRREIRVPPPRTIPPLIFL
jgi:hypothetical protein